MKLTRILDFKAREYKLGQARSDSTCGVYLNDRKVGMIMQYKSGKFAIHRIEAPRPGEMIQRTTFVQANHPRDIIRIARLWWNHPEVTEWGA